MNIIPDDEKLIGKTIVGAEIGGYGIKLKFSDGSILDYDSSSDGDSCWEIIDDTQQVEMNKLKPCPFCGGGANVDWGINRYGPPVTYNVECRRCTAKIEYPYDSEEEAIEAWNRRVDRNKE